jgi:hypothetical protein
LDEDEPPADPPLERSDDEAPVPPEDAPLPEAPEDAPRDELFLSGALPIAEARGGNARATVAVRTAR